MVGEIESSPRVEAPKPTKANAHLLASKGAGLSNEVLARALETRSTAPRRALGNAQALLNQEAARRYARAKAILAQKAKEARLAAGLPPDETMDVASVPAHWNIWQTRLGQRCQPFAKRLTHTARRIWRHRQDWGWRSVACASVAMAALLVVYHDAGFWFHGKGSVHSGAAGSPAWQVLSSRDWFQRAEDRAAEGNFRRALNTVQYALAASPKNVDLLIFAGDMHQSLFEFSEAQSAYEQALRFDPNNTDARESLALCRRLNRYHGDAVAHRSTLYGLHRVMLGQRRIAEAVAICRRLGTKDRNLQQATWQAALSETGMPGRITIGAGGDLELDLSGTLQPDLSVLQPFPIANLNLANTGVEDIAALKGMKLKRLDLSRTLVHDLAPLAGMPLQILRLRGTGVVELSAVRNCPLLELDISETRVGDLGPLARMPLNSLRAANTPVSDLRPLATVPLVWLNLARTRVADLGPLSSLGLKSLNLEGTRVTDLTALKGCRLHELILSGTAISDLSALAEMPLTVLALTDCAGVRDLRPLATCPELEHLQTPPHPLFMDRLAALPRLRFIRRDETRLEDMMLLSGPSEPAETKLEDMLLLSSSGELSVPPHR